MAYSPLEQAKLVLDKSLRDVARRLGATPAQVALAWVLRVRQMIAIPKSGRVNGVQENRQALDIQLGAEDIKAIDEAFPPPRRKVRLEMI
jgi:diketogulonate reductase-like aldo/keto reductase